MVLTERCSIAPSAAWIDLLSGRGRYGLHDPHRERRFPSRRQVCWSGCRPAIASSSMWKRVPPRDCFVFDVGAGAALRLLRLQCGSGCRPAIASSSMWERVPPRDCFVFNVGAGATPRLLGGLGIRSTAAPPTLGKGLGAQRLLPHWGRDSDHSGSSHIRDLSTAEARGRGAVWLRRRCVRGGCPGATPGPRCLRRDWC